MVKSETCWLSKASKIFIGMVDQACPILWSEPCISLTSLLTHILSKDLSTASLSKEMSRRLEASRVLLCGVELQKIDVQLVCS